MTSMDATEPVLLEVWEVARLIGWERRRALRLLRLDLKIAVRLGRKWVVEVDALRTAFPQAHRELLRRREMGEAPEQQRRPRRQQTTKAATGGQPGNRE